MERSASRGTPDLLRAFRDAVRAKIARDLTAETERAARLRMEVVPAVARGLAEARRRSLCDRAWLFGSYAWGQPSERSDVDLLIEGTEDPMLVAAIVGASAGREVHIVRLDRAPDSLRNRVLAEGLAL